jgi:hypothetical protein
MGYGFREKLKDYKSKMEDIYIPFYNSTLKHNRLLHIVCFLHLEDFGQGYKQRLQIGYGKNGEFFKH